MEKTDTLSRLLDTAETLPSGHHKLSRETVIEAQRKRLLLGMMEVVAEQGYPETTVAHIIKRSGVSRRTFYELFQDKEACFLAAYRIAHEALVSHILNATRDGGDWRSGFDAAFGAYLDFLAGRGAATYLFMVEAYSAGPVLAEEIEKANTRFAEMIAVLFRQGAEETGEFSVPPGVCIRALIGGVNELVALWIRSRRHEQLQELKPALLYLTFSLVSAEEARPYRESTEWLDGKIRE